MLQSSFLKNKLKNASPGFLSVYVAIASFGVYFCMYAFRKPFTAAGFEGISFLHIDYKIWLVAAQVIGYMLSKFYGIYFISSMKGDKRAPSIIILISVGWAALLLFAITPAPYNIFFLFLNGFPLGLVWGLVFSYIEGRKTTEFMGAVLCSSFIFSSGVVKTVGKSLMLGLHVSEFWMPFATGALFFIPLLLFTFLLNQTPPPTKEDMLLRSPRAPMSKHDRSVFLQRFLPGIVVIVGTYVLLTVLRDFRDNFSNELYTELGYGNNAAIFSVTEIPVSVIVLASMALLMLVKNNFRAFMINHYMVMFGYVLAMVSTILFNMHYITAVIWMTLVGTGLYLSYVPFNALYFERMIATYSLKGNIGFIMYIADAFGYLGSVVVLLIKSFVGVQLSWTAFFTGAVIIICSIGLLGTLIACLYFKREFTHTHSSSSQIAEPGYVS